MKTLHYLACAIVLTDGITAATAQPVDLSRLPLRQATAGAAADYSKAELLVGLVDHVFIARVGKEQGTFKLVNFNWPSTLWQVSVVTNIKGNLQGQVEIIQEGGVMDGFYHRTRSSDPLDPDGAGLLKAGATYILAVSSLGEATRYTNANRVLTGPLFLVSGNYSRILLSTDPTISDQEIARIARLQVARLLEGYANEKLSPRAASRPAALNSFSSLSADEKARLQRQLDALKKDLASTP